MVNSACYSWCLLAQAIHVNFLLSLIMEPTSNKGFIFIIIEVEYLRWAVNVVSKSPKSSGATKRDIFQLLRVMKKDDKSDAEQISAVFGIL